MYRIRSALILALALTLIAIRGIADIGMTATPANLASPPSEMTVGSDGNLWILTESGKLGRLTPAGAYTEFGLQFGDDPLCKCSNASNLGAGVDGNVWLTGRNGHVERVTTSGAVTDYDVAPKFNGEASPVLGADGAIWFLDFVQSFGPTGVSYTSLLRRVDMYGRSTSYDLGFNDFSTAGLVAGGDGDLWFLVKDKSQIARFSVLTGKVNGTFPLPATANPNSGGQTVLGPDGAIWFTRGSGVDRIDVKGNLTEFHAPSGGDTAGIALGADGNIWFTEYAIGKIGQLLVSSVNGSSATINETSALVPNAYKLLLLPPGFTSPPATATAVPLETKPCPLITFMVKKTPPTAGIYVSTTVQENACADIASTLILEAGWRDGSMKRLTKAFVAIRNGGPQDASKVNSVITFTGPADLAIDDAKPSACDDLTVSVDGLTVVVKKPSLVVGDVCGLNIFFSELASVSGTAVSFSAETPDQNPRNNVASTMYDASVNSSYPLDPDTGDIVITPVIRGK